MKNHVPVLAHAFIEGLLSDPDGYYIDATFGRGGHTRMLLNRLSNEGHVLALDRDPQAIEAADILTREDPRFQIVHSDFAGLENAIYQAGSPSICGIGFDLGVSSPQIDQAERGFSFQVDGPLDMRMDPSAGQPLSERLKRLSEKELTHIIRSFGDERFAGRIARTICAAVQKKVLSTTRELENICFHAMPPKARHGSTHPATRTFQALRIWVNDEYGQIDTAIKAAMHCLAPHGRLAVISFHSGEDRRIRDLIEAQVHPCTCPREFPMCICGKTPSMRWIQKKPIRANDDELSSNPRSRSAMLRIAERLPESAI
ncbi:MAG: 16S rRNA (cytosine(1402)-N(4))-methyltransferase RsmH [Mariprofundaceae bacterium]|nr:16S rRNA (cytosine(1402)-N(4))-methyltransferase RsmH [Mariprofundaceae bacterium]